MCAVTSIHNQSLVVNHPDQTYTCEGLNSGGNPYINDPYEGLHKSSFPLQRISFSYRTIVHLLPTTLYPFAFVRKVRSLDIQATTTSRRHMDPTRIRASDCSARLLVFLARKLGVVATSISRPSVYEEPLYEDGTSPNVRFAEQVSAWHVRQYQQLY